MKRRGSQYRLRLRPDGRRGFTLLELMVALAILAILTTLLMVAGNQITSSWGRLTREQERFAELMALDRTLDHVLTNTIPFLWRDSQNADITAFLGELERIRLAYLHRANTAEDGAIRFIGIRLEDGQVKAFYMERPFLDWEAPSPNWRESILARDVESLTFQYADWKPLEKELVWSEDWDPERKEIPLGVMVSVKWKDGREESWLRRTAGNGVNERFGVWRPGKPQ